MRTTSTIRISVIVPFLESQASRKAACLQTMQRCSRWVASPCTITSYASHPGPEMHGRPSKPKSVAPQLHWLAGALCHYCKICVPSQECTRFNVRQDAVQRDSHTIMAHLHHVHPRPFADLTAAATTRISDCTRHVAPPHLTSPRKLRQAARDTLSACVATLSRRLVSQRSIRYTRLASTGPACNYRGGPLALKAKRACLKTARTPSRCAKWQ